MDWRVRMSETPFGKATRQNFRAMNVLDYAASGRDSEAIPRVGYLARIYWHFNGTLTVTLAAGTAALDVLGPWNALSRVRVQANSGQDIFSTSGYGNFLLNRCMLNGWEYSPSYEGFAPTALSYSPQVFAAPTASGANTWDFGLVIPIAMTDESELGLILLQNEQAVTSLAMEFGSVFSLTAAQAPVLVTGAATATLTGTITPMLEYFAVPADPASRPDISWMHQILEFTQPIAGVGENAINHLRDNLYLQILHHMVLANAPNTTDVDRMRLVINQSDTPYDFLKRPYLQLARHRYHNDLPLGVYLLDFMYQGLPGYGGERDLVNGRATSELQSILTIASGATIGANARFDTITRQLVKLQVPAARIA